MYTYIAVLYCSVITNQHHFLKVIELFTSGPSFSMGIRCIPLLLYILGFALKGDRQKRIIRPSSRWHGLNYSCSVLFVTQPLLSFFSTKCRFSTTTHPFRSKSGGDGGGDTISASSSTSQVIHHCLNLERVLTLTPALCVYWLHQQHACSFTSLNKWMRR